MKSALQWDDARVYLAVARTGSLSAAAQELQLGIATVSRRLARLEQALGVTLFSRHQTGYCLTDDGQLLLPKAEAIELAAQGLHAQADALGAVSGCVRLATAENLASPLIVPSLPALLQRYPELKIELISAVDTVNLHRRDADIAIRLHRPQAGNLTIRRLGVVGFGLYASTAYWQSRENVRHPDNLQQDRFIVWSKEYSHLPAAKWLKQKASIARVQLELNTLTAQIAACIAGLGLAVLPHYLAQPAGLLCVQATLGVDQEIWLAMHTDLAYSNRVRVVADHCVAVFEQQRLLLNPAIRGMLWSPAL